jgi:hypothetical protein
MSSFASHLRSLSKARARLHGLDLGNKLVDTPNLFHGLPSTKNNQSGFLSEEVFDTILQSSTNANIQNISAIPNGFKLERIISTGQVTPVGEVYDQSQGEWVAVLQGEAILSVEDTEIDDNSMNMINSASAPADEEKMKFLRLIPGSYVYLPKHKKHRVGM